MTVLHSKSCLIDLIKRYRNCLQVQLCECSHKPRSKVRLRIGAECAQTNANSLPRSSLPLANFDLLLQPQGQGNMIGKDLVYRSVSLSSSLQEEHWIYTNSEGGSYCHVKDLHWRVNPIN